MKHPDAPMQPLLREYRITQLGAVNVFRVEFKTWFLRRWKNCSHYYPSLLAAEAQLRAIKFGCPDWLPVDRP